MTEAAIRPTEAHGSLPAHPLDPVRPEEFLAGRRILAGAGLLTESVRFAYYGLEEPPKDDVLAGQLRHPGQRERRSGRPAGPPPAGVPDRRGDRRVE